MLIGGREVKIIKLGKKGSKYHTVELLGADTDGRGVAGDEITITTNDLVPGQDNWAPSSYELYQSPCAEVGIRVPKTITHEFPTGSPLKQPLL